MKKVRVTGIVKLVNRVRQELTGPVTADQLSQLQETVVNSLQMIKRLLAEARVGIEAMPVPSRKAYQFLASIDFKSIRTQESAASNELPPSSVSFHGLRNYLDAILDELSSGADQSTLRRIQDSIRQSSENIEQQIRADGIRPEQLKPEPRAIRGWLAYFSEPEYFGAYVAEIEIARPIFDEAARHSKKVR